MAFKSVLAKLAANIIVPGIYRQQQNAVAIQQGMLRRFIKKASKTEFGKENLR